MAIVIGPVLKRSGGYAFDTWDARDGVSPGYAYPRIEDAIYARKALIQGTARGGAAPLVCQTMDEFLKNSTNGELLAA